MNFMPVIQRLTEGWGAKVGLSVALTIAYEDHAQIFAAFVALVCLDLGRAPCGARGLKLDDPLAAIVGGVALLAERVD